LVIIFIVILCLNKKITFQNGPKKLDDHWMNKINYHLVPQLDKKIALYFYVGWPLDEQKQLSFCSSIVFLTVSSVSSFDKDIVCESTNLKTFL
jgi:hypothetical protein